MRVHVDTLDSFGNPVRLLDGDTGHTIIDFDRADKPPNGDTPMTYIHQPRYRLGQELIVTWYSADGNDVEVRGGVSVGVRTLPQNPLVFVPYWLTDWYEIETDDLTPVDDTQATEDNHWSALQTKNAIDDAICSIYTSANTGAPLVSANNGKILRSK